MRNELLSKKKLMNIKIQKYFGIKLRKFSEKKKHTHKTVKELKIIEIKTEKERDIKIN